MFLGVETQKFNLLILITLSPVSLTVTQILLKRFSRNHVFQIYGTPPEHAIWAITKKFGTRVFQKCENVWYQNQQKMLEIFFFINNNVKKKVQKSLL